MYTLEELDNFKSNLISKTDLLKDSDRGDRVKLLGYIYELIDFTRDSNGVFPFCIFKLADYNITESMTLEEFEDANGTLTVNFAKYVISFIYRAMDKPFERIKEKGVVS